MTDRPREQQRTDRDRAAHRRSAPEGAEEVIEPPTDPVREAERRDIDDAADANDDPERRRHGGLTASAG